MNRIRTRVALAAAFTALLVAPLSGQSRSSFILAGYGSTTFEGAADNDLRNDFTASISPVLLYTKGSDFLFEAELEFGLSGDATTTTLEYAQIDYLGLDNFQFIVGKFLLPFGVFGERIHPTWINKLPTSPILFGHGHGGVAEGSLMPVLSDAGAMMRWTRPMGSTWALAFSGYVTQGPGVAEEGAGGHDHSADPVAASESVGQPVAFGVSFSDNNKNKLLGGRLGLVRGGGFEVYASGFHAQYDDENFLDYYAGAVSAEWRAGGFEFRGEGVHLWKEFQDTTDFETLNESGFYLQGSYRVGSLEPVVRWGKLNESTVSGSVVEAGHSEVAIGMVYWLDPTLPMKAAWEIHEGRSDEFALQFAFGF